ncbi:hypothetical protein COE80_04900 [Bacillus pseudomycoides]|uniref:aminotransferase class III-fold pyridoxal phosphate-dependent enzyme n=1 Tax=Bacillus pseudomycoides TaxID=64104 RepID=UPI000BFD2A32|nr:aminotransferase class III-fold pyridoxal phosphate-dependent enzyme [Bacillus pseudomycoides]PHB30015.1 hypothetical protein COE80_04900 [Bacillus pseudomycoides]
MDTQPFIKGLEFNIDDTVSTKKQNIVSKRDVAIIGMACEFADSKSNKEFWENLREGHDSIRRLSGDRMADMNSLLKVLNLAVRNIEDESEFGCMEHIDYFDNNFFSITPNEAKLMDPNQRILLQNIWKTIEDAGYNGDRIIGTKTGVFIGFGSDFKEEYKSYIMHAYPDLYSMSIPGNIKSILASRISYLLDLKGPSLVVDTACSSSLVAIHLACQSLKNKECEMAIAGGIDIRMFHPRLDNVDIGIVSSNSRTRSFDDSSDGSGAGEGVGTILLKPLYKAIEDKDPIYAVIKGSASNQDGASIGITAPNPVAQEKVIVEAWKDARIEPETISYIEAHGSGTKLGDPIEIDGITRAFRKFTDKKQFCAIGSVKTNVGHLGNAAGIAGVIKSVLSLQNKEIPPSIHFNFPNQKINFEESPVYVNNILTPWESKRTPRRCGVSSFGMSGTNCHLVLEEAPTLNMKNTNLMSENECYIFTLSAKTEEALWDYVNEYKKIESLDDIKISDLAYTVNNRRGHYSHRLAIVVHNSSDLKVKINSLVELRENQELGIYYGHHEIVPSSKHERLSYEYTIKEINALSDKVLETENKFKIKNQDSIIYAKKLADLYVNGAIIHWQDLYNDFEGRVVHLPTYPFEKRRCWLELPTKGGKIMNLEKDKVISNNKDLVEEKVKFILSNVSGINVADIGMYNDFFEMGFDSILITHLMNYIQDELGIDISLSQFYGELSSPTRLVDYIASRVNLVTSSDNITVSKISNVEEIDVEPIYDLNENLNLEDVINKQLNIMQYQLELLKKGESKNLKKQLPVKGNKKQQETFIPYQKLSDLKDVDQEHNSTLHELLAELPIKTKESKNHIGKNRIHLANNRNVAGFRPKLKELVYPIVIDHSDGSKITDIDGNEYIDITMGFGVNILGHNHPLIINSIQEELRKGNAIGPMSKLAGEVASLISELTGVDRVSFFNSGTEANMVALRLARAYTGKNKIVVFAGSFHGTFDGVLARAKMGDSVEGSCVPLAPGITQNSVKDVIVLDYNDPQSLQVIRDNADDLAAVLVEPVQSRRPDIQPREFLQELRKITLDKGIALIFDEIITGFRIHPGGAQKWFGVEADIVTYGKVVGGGMPIGIVAGKQQYMDCIDGGTWSFGDDSYPINDSKRTFIAGTFCHHPLAMSSSLAILKLIKEKGIKLLEDLNNKTSNLVSGLNKYFINEHIPIEVVNFGSLFRFKSSEDIELFYYNLLNNGIYIWEGRNCFLSLAHDEEDIEKIIIAVRKSANYLKKKQQIVKCEKKKIPLSSAQQKIYMIETLKSKGSAYRVPSAFFIEGKIDIQRVRSCLKEIIQRHEILRTSFHYKEGETFQVVNSNFITPLEIFKLEGASLESIVESFYKPYDLSESPLCRFGLVKVKEDKHLFLIDMHHIVSDGMSIVIFQKEFIELYLGKELKPLEMQYQDFCLWSQKNENSAVMKKQEKYWLEIFSDDIPVLEMPLDFQRPSVETFDGKKLTFIINKSLTVELNNLSKRLKSTLFMLLLSMYKITIYKYTAQRDLVIGTSVLGRNHSGTRNNIGMFLNFVPIRTKIDEQRSFTDYISQVRNATIDAFDNQDYPIERVINKLGNKLHHVAGQNPLYSTMFILDNMLKQDAVVEGLSITEYPLSGVSSILDFHIEAAEQNGEILLNLIYNKNLFSEEMMMKFGNRYVKLIEEILLNPNKKIIDLEGSNRENEANILNFNEEIF